MVDTEYSGAIMARLHQLLNEFREVESFNGDDSVPSHGVALPRVIVNHQISVLQITGLVCMFRVIILVKGFKIWAVPDFLLVLVGIGCK